MAGLEHATNLFIASFGLAALFILISIEEAGVWLPLPGDLLIVYFGYRAAQTSAPVLSAIPVMLTIIAACLCGSTLLYLLVRRFRWLLRRYGHLFQLNENRLRWMEEWLQRHGIAVIIPARLVPGLRVATTVVSSSLGVPLPVFLPAVAVAALLWGALFLVVGAAGKGLLEFGQDVLQAEISEWLLPVAVVATLLGLLLHLWHPWRRAGTHD